MAKILNIQDYGVGYDQGYQDGHNEGYQEGHDAAVQEYERRVAALNAQIVSLTARMSVLERKI